MRVIAGMARSIQLKAPKGEHTRPTTDRIKETLFNMLNPYLTDSCFLDLFSGSGAIGIEALSRGAAEAVFVENDREAAACIRENLAAARVTDRSRILAVDVIQGLTALEGQHRPFDIVFMDPPYNCNFERKILEYLRESRLVHKDSLIIYEAAVDNGVSFPDELGYTIEKIKKYKTNMHVFLHRNESRS